MTKNTFHRWFGPGFANGIGFDVWIRLLRENGFRISASYWGRAATITGASFLNSIGGTFEDLWFDRAVAEVEVRAPLFVLGAPRSGTTHLHNLISQDDQFSFPNTFQAINPRIFLTTEWWFAAIQDLLIPSPRPMDNMAMNSKTPMEDEFGIMGLCGISPFCEWMFPQGTCDYQHFWTLERSTPNQREQWKAAFLTFLRKLQYRDPRRLVLKSPSHTGRIPILLELFPDAKFVHIHRHPYEVYASMLNLADKVVSISTLQTWDMQTEATRAIDNYCINMDAYFDHRERIPRNNLVEVSYEDLDRMPLPTLRTVYEGLALHDFQSAMPAVGSYVNSLKAYKKNEYPELNATTKELLQSRWGRTFREWGYEV